MKILILLLAGFSICCNAKDLPEAAKRLIEQKQQAIEAIDKRFAEELKKLQQEYMKQGDLDAANAVAKLLGGSDNKAEAAVPQILGEWNFFHKGLKRVFRFADNGTYIGHYSVSGNEFVGTWRGDGDVIVLEVNGVKGRHGTIKIRKDGGADYRSGGYEMEGKRP